MYNVYIPTNEVETPADRVSEDARSIPIENAFYRTVSECFDEVWDHG